VAFRLFRLVFLAGKPAVELGDIFLEDLCFLVQGIQIDAVERALDLQACIDGDAVDPRGNSR